MSHVLLLVWWQWKCEKWSDYRYILNVEYKGFTDGLNVVAKRKKRKQGWGCHDWDREVVLSLEAK